jgi:hypothetical protein
MASFGVCDYLTKNKIPSKILNIIPTEWSIDPDKVNHNNISISKHLEKLDNYIHSFSPTYVTILFHWKEAISDFVYIGEYIRNKYPNIKILSGGFTASYFGVSLLKKYSFLDYIIRGDPELPILSLLKNKDITQVPNLIYRDNSEVRVNIQTYRADSELLSTLSYTNLEYLFDYKDYINFTDRFLGFPIYVGRGCVHNCLYCGASREAMLRHNVGKNEKTYGMVVRSVDSIIDDLKVIKKYTNRIFISYESDMRLMKKLLKRISEDSELKKYFYITYGAWKVLDEEMVYLLRDAFKVDSNKSIIEVSPEVFDETDRKLIKNGGVYYSNNQYLESMDNIKRILGGRVQVVLFYSRYHKTHNSFDKLIEEYKNLIELRDKLKHINYKFDYTHVATDVGSRYWQEYIDNPREINSFIRELKRLDKTSKDTGIHFGNLCFYFPNELNMEDIMKFEMIVHFDESLSRDKTSYHYVLNDYNHSEYLNILICIYEKYFRGLKVNEVLHDTLRNKFIRESTHMVRKEFQSKQKLYKGKVV